MSPRSTAWAPTWTPRMRSCWLSCCFRARWSGTCAGKSRPWDWPSWNRTTSPHSSVAMCLKWESQRILAGTVKTSSSSLSDPPKEGCWFSSILHPQWLSIRLMSKALTNSDHGSVSKASELLTVYCLDRRFSKLSVKMHLFIFPVHVLSHACMLLRCWSCCGLSRLTWGGVGHCVLTDVEVLVELGQVAVRLSPLGKITVSRLRGRRWLESVLFCSVSLRNKWKGSHISPALYHAGFMRLESDLVDVNGVWNISCILRICADLFTILSCNVLLDLIQTLGICFAVILCSQWSFISECFEMLSMDSN